MTLLYRLCFGFVIAMSGSEEEIRNMKIKEAVSLVL